MDKIKGYIKGYTAKKGDNFIEGSISVDTVISMFGNKFGQIDKITDVEYDDLINYTDQKKWMIWKKNFETWKKEGMEFTE